MAASTRSLRNSRTSRRHASNSCSIGAKDFVEIWLFHATAFERSDVEAPETRSLRLAFRDKILSRGASIFGVVIEKLGIFPNVWVALRRSHQGNDLD